MTVGPSTNRRDAIINGITSINLYAEFYNGAPARDGTGGTVVTSLLRSGGRLLIPATTSWAAISNDGTKRRTSNSVALASGNSLNNQDVTHTALFDASTGGNCVGILSTPFTATAGAPVTFAIGALVIEVL